MDSNDIQNLMLGTLKELGQRRFQQIAETMVVNQKVLRQFLGLNTPEKIAAHEAARKAEAARLAAIEAAKTPAQRRKEKQAACDHHFERNIDGEIHRSECIRCGKKVAINFARGYMAGHDKGYDAGRDSVDCDC